MASRAQDEIAVPAGEAVAPGLWLLRGRPRHAINVYVAGDALLDSSTRHGARRILRQIEGLPVRRHVLTHGHFDHMGSSHEICERLGLPLACGEGDVAAVESGGRAGLAQKPAPVRVWHRLIAGPGHPVDSILREGDRIGEFEVLVTPGHSPGHLAFWRESDRVLIIGDVLFHLRGLSLPPSMLTPDPETNLVSARRLAALQPQVVCFGHGPPLRDPEALRNFVASASP